ncbi:MAG: S9 family peptidase [Micromonosporaceae bacterium]|nr:S9 family peptidase [Micromonosporaceae bacterium]
MVASRVLPYGQWPSPIGVDLVADVSDDYTWPSIVDGQASGREVWWCAPDRATATVRLCRRRPGGPAATEVLGAGWSVRSRIIGYGGRPYLATTGLLVFVNHGDQRLYRADPAAGPAGQPTPLTPPDPEATATCYGDPVLGPGGAEVWCVREVTQPGPRVSRQIVAVPLDGSAAADPAAIRVVATSHHFLSGVRVSPDGAALAWIGWDHPQMPWDATELMVAELSDGVATGARRVLGGDGVSVPQAEWAGPGTLYAMADPDGWWNLHRVELDRDRTSAECVLPMARECAGPLWRVGATWFAVTGAGVVLRHGVGAQRLARWDPETGELHDLATGWTRFGPDLAGGTGAVVATAAAEDREWTVLLVPTGAAPVALTTPAHEELRPWIPVAQRRTATGTGGREVHYVYHPPTNPEATGPAGEVPPLLVHVHGGPTSGTDASPDLEFALFCSRGFAVASVDYGGSTGYGREYRERLRHNWGIVDVEDSIAVARDLAAQGLADPERTAIRGGSAGGWTSLACLASTDTFCAGAVYYPISDPTDWNSATTHDFESQYLRGLIGEWPADRERYEQVSPLSKVDNIRAPLVMLQGADDFICKPDQAQRIVDAVRARGLWYRYLVFEGEGHGFRKRESVAASLRAEAELYREAMGLAVELDGPG